MNLQLKGFLFTLFFGLFFITQAQEDQVLFTVENVPVYANEFLRVYNKNLDLVKDDSQKEMDAYLKLFINYKLKLTEARRMKLDQKQSYIRELESYKKQLSKNYLTDSKVTDTLIREAYERLKLEVNADHILVRVDENAMAKDTLAAYNEILKLRKRVLEEGYEAVQQDVHNGKTLFAENLGYFTAFKMVYPFENAAYNTEIGEVSMPFRTRFGYHVVKVIDKRASRGEVSVAHIMLKDNPSSDANDEIKINEIYQRLKQGEAFDALAKQFSQDKSSSAKGGMLKPFSGGELSSLEFEEMAFGLNAIGAISKPFKTNFGWHIIKLIDKKPMPTYKDMRAELESKIKRDSRSKIINDSRVNDLKARYSIVENSEGLNYFKTIVTLDYLNRRWNLPSGFEAKKPLVKIQDKQLYYEDFGNYLMKSQRNNNSANTVDAIVENEYKAFLDNELLRYQEDNLIIENKAFSQIVEEYRDGLLIFDLMESEIWNAAKKDSLALEDFFHAHETNYFFKERVKAIVASSAKKGALKKVIKLFDENKSIEEIKNVINTNNIIHVSFTTGEMEASHQALPDAVAFKPGMSKIYKHNDAYVVVKVEEVLPKTQKTFKEAKGKVISDYQEYKEAHWLKELASKYAVKVNQEVLESVKRRLN
ncbi:peptidylprolyl isomerase [Lacinutrix neustonica]|uniref:Peptidylprolyl isomerase n=1 Tax=Lacinutrix neustonica TaxID=2980107 RepID=A0A9E8SGR7_9FLAO|nr:peptidylprolyl isomerase [Lacinutrix neustonica]WAC02000.1 peptidylprolyl isomerase [Lacinutrix neustonica]